MNKAKFLVAILILLTLCLGFGVGRSKLFGYIYEPEEGERDLFIDKKVSMPRENNEGDLIFKDNLREIEEERYQKDQIVVFELRVKNTGDETLEKVTVKDRFPDYVDIVDKDDPNWDPETKTYTYEIYDLEPGEEDVRRIEAIITEDVYLCVTNEAEAIPSEGDKDVDTAQICIGKKALGVAAQPETGADVALIVMSMLGVSGLGLRMKKKN